MADKEHHEHDDDDHGGTGKYWVVFVCLCILTTASFLTYFDFWKEYMGEAKMTARMFMLAVAVVKASLVMLFFMHLKWEANWKYVLTIPSLMMAIFLMIALVPDIGMRTVRYAEERSRAAASPEAMPVPLEHHGDEPHAAEH